MIIPTPSLAPIDVSDYQKQNEIIRYLALGICNIHTTYNAIDKFVIKSSAGVLDISIDDTIKLLSFDSDLVCGIWLDTAAKKYLGVNYNDDTSQITTAWFDTVYYIQDNNGYWSDSSISSASFRILDNTFYSTGTIAKGIL